MDADAPGVAWKEGVGGQLYESVIVCISASDGAVALFPSAPLSILTLISPDLSNLALLYPIILITPMAALPHHLYANGLSLLW